MQKRDTQTAWICPHCRRAVIDHNDTVVVTIGNDLAFFHGKCYDEFIKAFKRKHDEEGFG